MEMYKKWHVYKVHARPEFTHSIVSNTKIWLCFITAVSTRWNWSSAVELFSIRDRDDLASALNCYGKMVSINKMRYSIAWIARWYRSPCFQVKLPSHAINLLWTLRVTNVSLARQLQSLTFITPVKTSRLCENSLSPAFRDGLDHPQHQCEGVYSSDILYVIHCSLLAQIYIILAGLGYLEV